VLQDRQAIGLQELRLQYFCFTQIDLCRACSLTSLVLKYVDAPHHTDCELFLPRSLHRFEFRGKALFAANSKFKIKECDSLTRLGISASSVYPIDAYSIPVLPSSLHHLEVFRSSDKNYIWVNGYDWQSLTACTNLERLTLPRTEYLTPWMRNWIKSARHVHVIEYESD